MARMPEFEILYKTYQEFAQSCFIEDRSFLWPEVSLWTPANVAIVKHALIDSPLLGKGTFEEKLNIQMEGLPAETWGLLADAYYLYCLIPVDIIKPLTKQNGIMQLAMKSSFTPPDLKSDLWAPLQAGFCNPGQRYNQKFREIWFILIFAEQVKKLADRASLFGNRIELQKMLDTCVTLVQNSGDQAKDMRHAILYLAYPDFYERSVSTTDKNSFVEVFKDRLSHQPPSDLDEAIYQIRQELEKDVSMPKPFDFYYDSVKPLWRNPVQKIEIGVTPVPPEIPEPVVPPAKINSILKLFLHTKNVILYGPPGTGKTYLGNLVAQELIRSQLQKPIPEKVLLQSIAENNTVYDSLALGMYVNGKDKHYSVKELVDLPLLKARFITRPVQYPNEAIWGYLQMHTSLKSKTVKTTNKSEPYLFEKGEDSRWFLTSLGQSYVEQTLSDTVTSLKQPNIEIGKSEDFISRVSFHQSYAYEDFVEGFRPISANEIEVVPGIFREICAQSANNPNSNYVLIIDEINRGNISKIFGELITLLEDDKRDGQQNSLSVELAYSRLKFKVPPNLFIIGTMNTADRSIALLDVALRRRFTFYELLPDPSLLKNRIIQDADGNQVNLTDLLTKLNKSICDELGSDYQIGHSYFMKVNSLATLEFVWNYQILPILREYFYSQPDRLSEILEQYVNGQEIGNNLQKEERDLLIALSGFLD